MESDPEKADQNKSLWEEVKVTGVKFNFYVFSCLKYSYICKSKSNELSLDTK